MKLGVMQPYFIPYLGYFSLINAVDKWVVFDLSQHKPKSWMTRNRLLYPKKGFIYSSVALENNSVSIQVKDAMVISPDRVRCGLLGKLSVYKSMKAPHYQSVISIIERAFDSLEDRGLVALNISLLKSICEYLLIDFNYSLSSCIDFDRSAITKPGDWALEISRAVDADVYINPISGDFLFDKEKYKRNGVDIRFLDYRPIIYSQARDKFIDNLSVLDVIMWNDRDKIIEYINNPLFNVIV